MQKASVLSHSDSDTIWLSSVIDGKICQCQFYSLKANIFNKLCLHGKNIVL